MQSIARPQESKRRTLASVATSITWGGESPEHGWKNSAAFTSGQGISSQAPMHLQNPGRIPDLTLTHLPPPPGSSAPLDPCSCKPTSRSNLIGKPGAARSHIHVFTPAGCCSHFSGAGGRGGGSWALRRRAVCSARPLVITSPQAPISPPAPEACAGSLHLGTFVP